MIGSIWCNNYSTGNNMLIKIVSQYGQKGIFPIEYKNGVKTYHSVEFDNGDKWCVCKATDSFRAYKSNIAYIERSIDINTIKCIILPTLIDFPFSAYHLFGKGNLHLTDEEPLPF